MMTKVRQLGSQFGHFHQKQPKQAGSRLNVVVKLCHSVKCRCRGAGLLVQPFVSVAEPVNNSNFTVDTDTCLTSI